MKYLLPLLSLSLFINSSAFGGAGFFDSYTIVNSTFYDLSADSINADFSGTNIGNFDTSDSLTIGGQLKSYKNGSTDVTGANISYAIYQDGESATFSDISYSWEGNLSNPGDQQWGTSASSSVSLSTLSSGNYQLSVYASVFTNGSDASPQIFDNAGGANYTASFTIVPEPSNFALIGSLFAIGLVAIRRKVRN